MKGRIRHPMYPAAALTAADPVLLRGELVYESDTRRRKIGDGATAWNALPYEQTEAAGPISGPFPGYQKIGGAGHTALDGTKTVQIDFTMALSADRLTGRHLIFDADLFANGATTLTCIPTAFAMLDNTDDPVPVVDFTTANPALVDPGKTVAWVAAEISAFDRIGNNIPGCTLTVRSGGLADPAATELTWHGIYIEE